MKRVVAVAPYIRKGSINFKIGPYNAWKNIGGMTASSHYLFQPLIGFFHNHELPTFWHSSREARLRFMEPINRYFDAFPDYMCYEIIPFLWDCWPCLDDRICRWLVKHEVRTAIFTSQQSAERIRQRLPQLQTFVVTEGIDITKYGEGKPLGERSIGLLEFGRNNRALFDTSTWDDVKCLFTGNLERRLSDEELRERMYDSQLVITLPRCDTDAKIADGVETLTQRYWEAMLTRMVMVGHAPKELVELIGYNPCIEIEGFISHRGMTNYSIAPLDSGLLHNQVISVLSHISDYQSLVDRNREVALRMASWELRMRDVMTWLGEIGYVVR